MMKIPAIVALLSGIAPWAVAEEPVKEAPALSIEALNKRGVTGQLGIPLGKLVWIDATIVAGDELKTKAARGSYLLKVTTVEGKPLDPPQILNFECPPYSRAEHLANSPFSLFELRNGKKAESLNEAQIAELNKGYVGKTFKLLVYELGSFNGIPQGVPDEVIWQDTGFHFSTYLSVLKSAEKR